MESTGEGLDVREPLIQEKPSEDRLERQWRFTTESARQALLQDHTVRQELISFAQLPVDEQLPNKFLSTWKSLERDEENLSLIQQLDSYLAIPSVPDELIQPDITNARILDTPQRHITMFKDIGLSYDEIKDELQIENRRGMFSRGITPSEREMVIRRYRFARDVKLLAFQSEMTETKGESQFEQDGEFLRRTLPSGTTILTDSENLQANQELLSPEKWEKRKQLKDRIYVITANDKQYILKEKKTARHTDTKRHGHQDGLSSEDEFRVANIFSTQGTIQEDEIAITWEKPLAAVTFPDGYQFTVFDYVPDLIDGNYGREVITEAIMKHPDAFTKDYAQLSTKAKDFLHDPRIEKWAWSTINLDNDPVNPELSFQDYAAVKAKLLTERTAALRQGIQDSLGYDNGDQDGYAYRITNEGNAPIIEQLGFDFEYFGAITKEEIDRKRDVRDTLDELEWDSKHIDYALNTRIQQAAYLASL